MTTVMVSEMDRDRLLDGWRGIAALMVAVTHGVLFRLNFVAEPGPLTSVLGRAGGLSVLVFFVISGYIITSLLLREEAEQGRVNVPAFYLRRTFRILPPIAVYIAVMIALHYARYIYLEKPSVIHAASFTCNLWEKCDWWLGHSWTLGVEEQFYLIMPLVFVLAGRWRAFVAAMMLAVLSMMVNSKAPIVMNNSLGFACISGGALLAVEPRLMGLIMRFASWWGWLIVATALLAPALKGWLMPALPVLILYLVFAARRIGAVRFVLESKPLQLLGMGSYSLYLWQQFFMAKPSAYLGAPAPIWILPFVVILSVICIEKPCTRLGRRLSQRIMR